MKNQYFGDINDFLKYGLLRCLISATGMKLGVCWLLTEDDKGNHGSSRQYLEEPARWAKYDPELFEMMSQPCGRTVQRSVLCAREWGILPEAIYFEELLVDSVEARNEYFASMWKQVHDCPMLFFDPDTGIEIESVKKGRRDSSKYILWDELREAYSHGHSLIIYQHFPHKQRDNFITEIARELTNRLGAASVYSFRTVNVVFFLVVQPDHAIKFPSAHQDIIDRWHEQIQATAHCRAAASGSAKEPVHGSPSNSVPEPAKRSPLERLKEVGFRCAGEWKLEANELSCSISELASAANVLYAFVEGDNILYIGKSIRSLRQRLYGYQNPGPTQFTNIKANKLICEALNDQRSISVFAFADPGHLRHAGFHVNLAAGLEDSLINTLKPIWNKAGV